MADLERWKQIGALIGALIRTKGYKSVELFAHEHGLEKSVLNRLIGGKREVRLSTFLKIVDALEIKFEGLEYQSGYTGTLRDAQLHDGPLKPRKTVAKSRILRLNLSEFDRIEIRRTARDKQPTVLNVS